MITYVNTEGWPNVTPDRDADYVYVRFDKLMREDPYLAFFTERVITMMVSRIIDHLSEPKPDTIYRQWKSWVWEGRIMSYDIAEALENTPVNLMMSYDFLRRIADLTEHALFPQGRS